MSGMMAGHLVLSNTCNKPEPVLAAEYRCSRTDRELPVCEQEISEPVTLSSIELYR